MALAWPEISSWVARPPWGRPKRSRATGRLAPNARSYNRGGHGADEVATSVLPFENNTGDGGQDVLADGRNRKYMQTNMPSRTGSGPPSNLSLGGLPLWRLFSFRASGRHFCVTESRPVFARGGLPGGAAP